MSYIIHISRTKPYRLRLADGRVVYMDWHHYCGPTFYHDRLERRIIEDWYEIEKSSFNKIICDALDWFCRRGKKA